MKKNIILSSLAVLFGINACGGPYTNVSVAEFEKLIAKPGVRLLDSRTAEEFAEGHIAGAVNVDVNSPTFVKEVDALIGKDSPVAVYCRSGRRSAIASQALARAGYKEIYNLSGGIIGWLDAGKATTTETAPQTIAMKETSIEVLKQENAIDLISKQWMLVTAGTKDSFNTMTANWGGLGYLWNKNVAFVFVRPERYTHDFIESNPRFTLSFYPEQWRDALRLCGSKSGRDTDKVKATGLTPVELPSGAMTFGQARLTLDCRKLFKTEMTEASFIDKETMSRWYGPEAGFHTIYVVEIEKVYTTF